MEEQYCIVTGGNTGIGKEVVAGLMTRGSHVVMACRDMQACAVAKEQLEQRGLAGTCQCSRLDLSSTPSIHNFAKEHKQQLKQHHKHLQVLVNNAGVMGARPGPNGRDQHLVVNHLGPFLLTNLLLPHMTAGSRIINVSSRAHKWGHVAVKDNLIQPASNLWFVQYSRSKLCNILFTSELQRRLQQSRGIIATSVSPGFVNTTIYRSLSPSLAWLFCTFAPFLARTPAEGAKVAVFAATTDLLSADRPVPLLLHDCKPMAPKKLAQDSKLAADLWQASATAVGWTEER